jgi:hypothetical protein
MLARLPGKHYSSRDSGGLIMKRLCFITAGLIYLLIPAANPVQLLSRRDDATETLNAVEHGSMTVSPWPARHLVLLGGSMIRPILISSVCVLIFCAAANAQSTRRYDTSGGPISITRPNPVTTPSVRDPNLTHIGTVDTWAELAPKKNLPPTVIRVIGKDLHIALFNYTKKEGKLESSVAFQLNPFADKQILKVEVFAIEQNGQPVARTPLADAQTIPLKKQGAVLPFTVEMKEGETLTCEVWFSINGQERGKAKLKITHQGLSFAPDEKPGEPDRD